MAVNNPDKKFLTSAQGGKHKYCSNLLRYFNPRISRVKITMVIYSIIFHNIGTWRKKVKLLIFNKLDHFYTLFPGPGGDGGGTRTCDRRLMMQWKRINRKQSARWQHLTRLKASAFFSLQKDLVSCMKCNNFYSGLVMPSRG